MTANKKGQPGHYLNSDYKVDAIWINIESFEHLIDNHPEYRPRDVSSGGITNEQVINEVLGMLKKTGELILQDASNINKCISFITENFPHATFGSYQGVVGIENLSHSEMISCLQQESLHFDYARIDKDGQIPLEDIES